MTSEKQAWKLNKRSATNELKNYSNESRGQISNEKLCYLTAVGAKTPRKTRQTNAKKHVFNDFWNVLRSVTLIMMI